MAGRADDKHISGKGGFLGEGSDSPGRLSFSGIEPARDFAADYVDSRLGASVAEAARDYHDSRI